MKVREQTSQAAVGGCGWGLLQGQCSTIVSSSGFGGSGAGADMLYARVGLLHFFIRPSRRISLDEAVTLRSDNQSSST